MIAKDRLVEADLNDWTQVLEHSGHPVSAYQTRDWLDILSQGGYKPQCWISTGSGVGFCAVTRLPWPLRHHTLPLLTPYMGWVLPKSFLTDLEKLSESLDKLLASLKDPTIEVASPPQIPLCGDHLPNHGVRKTAIWTLATGSEGLMTGLRPAARRQWKKGAQDNRITVTESPDVSNLQLSDQLYRLLTMVWTRRGLTCPVTRVFFDSLVTTSVTHIRRKLWLGSEGGVPRAFVLTLDHGGTRNYTVAACHPDWLSSGLPTQLVVHSAIDACTQGLSYYDLIGANSESITRFKLGLGATLYDYPWISSPASIRSKFFHLARRCRSALGS